MPTFETIDQQAKPFAQRKLVLLFLTRRWTCAFIIFSCRADGLIVAALAILAMLALLTHLQTRIRNDALQKIEMQQVRSSKHTVYAGGVFGTAFLLTRLGFDATFSVKFLLESNVSLPCTFLQRLDEAERARRASEKLHQQKNEWIAFLCHELRNPLQSIVAASEQASEIACLFFCCCWASAAINFGWLVLLARSQEIESASNASSHDAWGVVLSSAEHMTGALASSSQLWLVLDKLCSCLALDSLGGRCLQASLFSSVLLFVLGFLAQVL